MITTLENQWEEDGWEADDDFPNNEEMGWDGDGGRRGKKRALRRGRIDGYEGIGEERQGKGLGKRYYHL